MSTKPEIADESSTQEEINNSSSTTTVLIANNETAMTETAGGQETPISEPSPRDELIGKEDDGDDGHDEATDQFHDVTEGHINDVNPASGKCEGDESTTHKEEELSAAQKDDIDVGTSQEATNKCVGTSKTQGYSVRQSVGEQPQPDAITPQIYYFGEIAVSKLPKPQRIRINIRGSFNHFDQLIRVRDKINRRCERFVFGMLHATNLLEDEALTLEDVGIKNGDTVRVRQFREIDDGQWATGDLELWEMFRRDTAAMRDGRAGHAGPQRPGPDR